MIEDMTQVSVLELPFASSSVNFLLIHALAEEARSDDGGAVGEGSVMG